eukprot:6592632-Pyramimonas_sp.AAC.1
MSEMIYISKESELYDGDRIDAQALAESITPVPSARGAMKKMVKDKTKVTHNKSAVEETPSFGK